MNIHDNLFSPITPVIEYNGQKYDLIIETRDFNLNPDCKIGCWELNSWFRTPKGIKAEPYKNIKTFCRAVEKTLKNKNIKILYWNLSKKYYK